jgi:hypothetical protein
MAEGPRTPEPLSERSLAEVLAAARLESYAQPLRAQV